MLHRRLGHGNRVHLPLSPVAMGSMSIAPPSQCRQVRFTHGQHGINWFRLRARARCTVCTCIVRHPVCLLSLSGLCNASDKLRLRDEETCCRLPHAYTVHCAPLMCVCVYARQALLFDSTSLGSAGGGTRCEICPMATCSQPAPRARLTVQDAACIRLIALDRH